MIRIMSRADIKELAQKNAIPPSTKIVSIRDPECQVIEVLDNLPNEKLVLWFHDSIDKRFEGDVLPSKEDVEKIIAFARTLSRDDDVIVHCNAGVSRSSCSAFIIEFIRSGSIEEALNILDPQWHYPNILMAVLASKILKDGRIYKVLELFNKQCVEGEPFPTTLPDAIRFSK